MRRSGIARPIMLPRRASRSSRAIGRQLDMDRGLGDAVHVDQLRPGIAVAVEPGAQGLEGQRFAAEDHVAQRQRLGRQGRAAVGLDQRTEGRRRLVEHRDPLAHQQVEQLGRRTRDRVGHHHHPAAVDQRAPDLPDREVEGMGVEEGPHRRHRSRTRRRWRRTGAPRWRGSPGSPWAGRWTRRCRSRRPGPRGRRRRCRRPARRPGFGRRSAPPARRSSARRRRWRTRSARPPAGHRRA